MRAGGQTTPGGPKLLLRLPDEPSPLQRDLVHQMGIETEKRKISRKFRRYFKRWTRILKQDLQCVRS